MLSRCWFLACVFTLGSSSRALAAETRDGSSAPAVPPPLWLDAEVDPLAYLLQGYSVHVGVRSGQLRFDLGAFALKHPEALAANPALEGRSHGAGLKLDWRFAQQPQLASDWATEFWRGAFVGIEASYAWLVVTDPDSHRSASQFQLHPSARAGWDIPIAAGFYLAPWLSLGPVLGPRSVQVAGQRWEASRLETFATIHLGWRSPWL